MTKVQFEIYTIACGMMQEGCTKSEALAYISIMKYNPEDVVVVFKECFSGSSNKQS